MMQQESVIALRAYAVQSDNNLPSSLRSSPSPIGHSEWALIFDTETTTDAAQQLRFGCYQLRKSGLLQEAGIFYDSASLNIKEEALLQLYAQKHSLELIFVQEFIEEIFFHYAYGLSALCIGFNLPFDLSRLATGHASARGKMRGGFSFLLSQNKERPRVQIKHLNSRASLIQFTIPAEQRTVRSRRKQGLEAPPHRGYFLDVKTLACALLSRSWSLKTLARHLDTEHQKLEIERHGVKLSNSYIKYAMADVQVTWECFVKLSQLYESYGLATPLTRIYSEASIGKACLQQMRVKPWRELQPDFPPELIGIIMGSYYGGRSEVHIRRQVVRVLYCDFLSMYPTVCTLMGLWKYVIAERIEWRDTTAETTAFLESLCLTDLQTPRNWKQLATLVQVQLEDDVFPTRAKYDGTQYTIGLNHLRYSEPLWYTLADCIASKLLTGKSPKIVKALSFDSVGTQAELKKICIAGNTEYLVDPVADDFYRRLIELRSDIKSRMNSCQPEERQKLDIEQMALKICANASSYGIFVELIVSEQDRAQQVICYGYSGKPFTTSTKNIEEPGRYFHPLLATLITGAARLMLALSERLADDAGITWALCDTDSMALAQPPGMSEQEFIDKALNITKWFNPLNPYSIKGALFKVEDVNYSPDGKGKDLHPLYCFAVSAKRYVLFNLDLLGSPSLRKASAHGLGHFRPPLETYKRPSFIPEPVVPLIEMGVELWECCLWYRIVEAALSDRPEQVRMDDLAGFKQAVVSRYAATTPALLRWFKGYNERLSYREQVKPFNFLLAGQVHKNLDAKAKSPGKLRPIAAYDNNHGKAMRRCFDRNTGKAINYWLLKTYAVALAQYHLQPESKFENADQLDQGITRRRHIKAIGIAQIGKEANRWEEQYYLGLEADAQIIYGMAVEDQKRWAASILVECRSYSQRALALASGLSLRHVSRVLCCRSKATIRVLIKLQAAIKVLNEE